MSSRLGPLLLSSINSKGILDKHYDAVIMTMLASQITSLTVVCSIVYSGANQRKHQSSASLAFVREIHRGPVNFPHKWPVTRKMFPFDDVIMYSHSKKRTDITVKCRANLLIHSQTSTASPLKLANGQVISLYMNVIIYPWCDLN